MVWSCCVCAFASSLPYVRPSSIASAVASSIAYVVACSVAYFVELSASPSVAYAVPFAVPAESARAARSYYQVESGSAAVGAHAALATESAWASAYVSVSWFRIRLVALMRLRACLCLRLFLRL